MSVPGQLKGKSVLVSGAASGIGRRLAQDLYWNEKCRLLLIDVDAKELGILKDELEPAGEGDRVDAFVCDIASEDSVERLVRAVGPRRIDVLVNNAGVAHLGSFERTEFADFERVVRINLLGTARMTKAFLPRLLKGGDGFIVNVASMAGLVGAPGMSAYVASKFGIVGFSDALHAELHKRVGIGVVCPTFVRTNIAKEAPGKADWFLGAVGSEPAKVSAAIIRTIKERKRLVLVNADAYIFYYLNRFFPFLSERAVATGYRMLKASGVVEQ
ncbi:MAG: SDR family NAD(P)-dependent oxidoreductase [Elusimicrobia bacterium]|nr:SDR family NAD(P)-dependent oxidoreductase [Elusimicrobiota bacterium]